MLAYNFVFFIVFLSVIFYSFYKIFTVNRKILISCKYINNTNILFIFVIIFGLLTLIFNYTTLDLIRVFTMSTSIVIYMFIKSGLSEDGIYISGSFYSYDDIEYYSYSDKKIFSLFIKTCGNKTDKYNLKLEFNIKNKEKICDLLKIKLIKKYKKSI